MNRRDFVWLGTMSTGATLLRAQTSSTVTLTLKEPRQAIVVPEDFIGLGYETSSPARLGLLSVKNQAYLNLVRALGPHGTMRFGGIVGDHTKYVADGPPKTDQDDTVMTRAAIAQAAEFLRATGWKAVWSVNFGTGTLENAIAELKDIKAILGDRLLAVEIGNEVEAYKNGKPPHRPDGYTYAQYRAEYAHWHDAIAKAVPGLRFYGPDTAGDIDWVEQMAADNAGSVQVLATHYYRAGQKLAEPDQLRVVDPKLADKVQRLRAASEASGLPWAICETNSYSGGGRPGLSDTLLGALWTLDYMLYLASNGCAAVNIETGVNQLGFVSSYSPIQGDGQGHNSAGVPYYGMLGARAALDGLNAKWGRTAFTAELTNSASTLTAYSFGHDKPETITLINRDSNLDVRVRFDGEMGWMAFPLGENQLTMDLPHGTFMRDGTLNLLNRQDLKENEVLVPHMSAMILVKVHRLDMPNATRNFGSRTLR